MTGMAVVTGATDEEAQQKLARHRQFASPEGALALFSGWTGIDLSSYRQDQQLDKVQSEGIQHAADYFTTVDPNRTWTVGEISEFLSIASIFPLVVGCPETIADELQRWVDEGDVDGFNLVPISRPSGFEDFVDLVVPELQRRGRMRTSYDGTTLRENFFGKGHKRLMPDHIAHKTLPPWKQDAQAAE